jgi:hypothetical protein
VFVMLHLQCPKIIAPNVKTAAEIQITTAAIQRGEARACFIALYKSPRPRIVPACAGPAKGTVAAVLRSFALPKNLRACGGRRRQAMMGPDFAFDRDEVVVCMVIAFCLGNAALTVIYRLMT